MAIVKAIHSSPLDLEYPHVTVSLHTDMPLCKCVFQSFMVDFMCACDKKTTNTEGNRLSNRNRMEMNKAREAH